MGGGRSNLRFIRLGVLVVFLVLATTLHRRGSAYNAIHVLYFVIIAGVVVAAIASRRRGGGGRGRFGPRGPSGGGSFGSGPPRSNVPPDNPNPDAGD
jgi:hypothetical protein